VGQSHRQALPSDCRLTRHLKIYFPQIRNWLEHPDTEPVSALLERWPTLEVLQKSSAGAVRVAAGRQARTDEFAPIVSGLLVNHDRTLAAHLLPKS
jgi:hypothetical protein